MNLLALKSGISLIYPQRSDAIFQESGHDLAEVEGVECFDMTRDQL